MAIATRFPKSWAGPKFDIKDPSLVLYIPFWYPDSETTGTTITSKDTNRHLCPVTGAAWGSRGRVMGNTKFISIPDNSILDCVDGFTIEVWTNMTSALQINWGTLVQKRDDTQTEGNAPGYMFTIVNGRLISYINNAAGDGVGQYVSDAAHLDGTWRYHAITYDKVKLRGYNSVGNVVTLYDAGTAYTKTIGLNTNNVWIGQGRTATYMAEGTIGEVRIYSRALTLAEMQRNYQVTKWRYA